MSNRIILYHGAVSEVKEPLTHVGRPELDFGSGFYLTKDKEQAENWAKTKASRKKNGIAFLNSYTFDMESFIADNNFQKLVFDDYSIEWLDFISANRKGQKLWAEYDWIEGGIANDSVISTVDAYVDGFINAQQALDKLVNEALHHQVCISNQAIIDKYLQFIDSVTL